MHRESNANSKETNSHRKSRDRSLHNHNREPDPFLDNY